MQLAISDANILVDLVDVGLLEQATRLPIQLVVPDIVLNEVTRPAQIAVIELLVSRGELTVLQANAEQIAMIADLSSELRALSIPDCAVLILGQMNRATILTNDSHVRRYALKVNLECHGTLWLLRRLAESGLASRGHVRAGLERLKVINPRLPRHELDILLKQLQEPYSSG